MRTWLLLPFFFSIFGAAAERKQTRDNSCSKRNDHVYVTPSGTTIPNSPCLPIYTSYNSYLVIDDHKYFWNENSYQANVSRPVVCKDAFDEGLRIFENVFLLDDDKNSDVPIHERLNRRIRPNSVIFDCEAEHTCCEGECCYFQWLERLAVRVAIFLAIVIVCCCSCHKGIIRAVKRKLKAEESEARRTEEIVHDVLQGINSQRSSSSSTASNATRLPRTILIPVRQTRSTDHQSSTRISDITPSVLALTSQRLQRITMDQAPPSPTGYRFVSTASIDVVNEEPNELSEEPPSYEEVTSTNRPKALITIRSKNLKKEDIFVQVWNMDD